ncbi:MAG: redoxin domain-containing protein, partial [Alphaproteobacteria bacterium]|nr:redoxin domain-containing protein [Alphaproteobacteria bacterium]
MAIRIQTGDRAPNFALPRTAEAATMFYEFARGVPMLLYFFDRIDQGPGHDGFEALVARSAAIAEHGQVLAVCRSPVAATSAALERRDLNFVVVSDEPGHVSAAFAQGAGRASSDGLTFLLDANQRVIEVVPGAGAPAVEAAWARLSDLPRPAGGSQRDALAPVLIIPNVLDDAWCRRIIEIWRTRGHEEGSVATTRNEAGRAINYGAKKRLDHHVTDLNLARDIALTIGPRLASETTKAFFFDEFKLDSFVICAYDSARGDFFKPHRDNLIPALAHRRFAVTINLNTDEFEGGGLRFAEYGAHTYRPPQGGAIVFSCSLLHEVLSPTKGTRFALLTFL